MIKLIPLLFTISTVNADILPFLLPDEGSHFNHHLQGHLKNSGKEIVIATPSMHYPSLRKNIIRSLSNGVNLTLIVSEPSGDPLYYTAYQGVNLYRYTPRSLSDTLILIDNTYVCHVSGPLSENKMSDSVSNVWCSDEPSLIFRTQKHLNTLIHRSTPYLQ